MAAGSDHTAVCTEGGQLFTFGYGESGELGRVTVRSYDQEKVIAAEEVVKRRVEELWTDRRIEKGSLASRGTARPRPRDR